MFFVGEPLVLKMDFWSPKNYTIKQLDPLGDAKHSFKIYSDVQVTFID